MLEKIRLCYKINHFYASIYKGLCPKWKPKDLDKQDNLHGILFDIDRTFCGYETRFSKNLKKSINALLGAKEVINENIH